VQDGAERRANRKGGQIPPSLTHHSSRMAATATESARCDLRSSGRYFATENASGERLARPAIG
jgi:hypothetical protein